jgi:hypothetical protein
MVGLFLFDDYFSFAFAAAAPQIANPEPPSAFRST